MKPECHVLSTKSKILVVGINPSFKKKKNPTLARLLKWMDKLEYTHFSFTNVLHKEGVYNKSDIDYNWIRECSRGYDKIICLGNFVSLAMADIPHHMMPHPSPLNRRLNSPEYEQQQLDMAAKYLWS